MRQTVLSWFGTAVQEPAESNEEPEELCRVCPASELVTESDGDLMEINGYTATPSNEDNGLLALLNPVLTQVQAYLKRHHMSITIKVNKLCNTKSGRNSWRCKRVRDPGHKYCFKCHTNVYASGKKRWSNHVVYDSQSSDRHRRYPIDSPDYITADWVRETAEKQNMKCYYCDKKMQTARRTASDGLTVERLTECLPHLKSICVLACGDCNRRSRSGNFCPYPIDQAKLLGFDLDEYHKFKGIPPMNLPNRLSIYRGRQTSLVE